MTSKQIAAKLVAWITSNPADKLPPELLDAVFTLDDADRAAMFQSVVQAIMQPGTREKAVAALEKGVPVAALRREIAANRRGAKVKRATRRVKLVRDL